MSHLLDIQTALKTALTPDLEGDNERVLVEVMSGLGFTYPPRSATNIRLLSKLLPIETIAKIVASALDCAMPDMALNNLERISSALPGSSLPELCDREDRLRQLLALLGSSPFLTNIICRDPASFEMLFSHSEIDRVRTEPEMVDLLRATLPPDIDFHGLFFFLRRFKYREMLRIAARDLSGLARLEEVTAELSSLAAATLQIAAEVTRSLLVAEHGIPILSDSGEEAELTILGMGKFGGRELNFSSSPAWEHAQRTARSERPAKG